MIFNAPKPHTYRKGRGGSQTKIEKYTPEMIIHEFEKKQCILYFACTVDKKHKIIIFTVFKNSDGRIVELVRSISISFTLD